MHTSPTGSSSTSGVFPIRPRTFAAALTATGHCRQQDHRRARPNFRLEPVERAHVLALDVDVRERKLLLECREPAHQIVEQVAHRLALRAETALTAGLL